MVSKNIMLSPYISGLLAHNCKRATEDLYNGRNRYLNTEEYYLISPLSRSLSRKSAWH